MYTRATARVYQEDQREEPLEGVDFSHSTARLLHEGFDELTDITFSPCPGGRKLSYTYNIATARVYSLKRRLREVRFDVGLNTIIPAVCLS